MLPTVHNDEELGAVVGDDSPAGPIMTACGRSYDPRELLAQLLLDRKSVV